MLNRILILTTFITIYSCSNTGPTTKDEPVKNSEKSKPETLKTDKPNKNQPKVNPEKFLESKILRNKIGTSRIFSYKNDEEKFSNYADGKFPKATVVADYDNMPPIFNFSA
ncbi:MAG: hypothetical protein KC505_04615, partial [Myxococcales bacterium]|nr:hypothetical protein [Myxococcales bacterium]